MPELFGINDTNVKSVMSKNVFTTFFPIATAAYMSSRNIPLKYVRVKDSGSLEIADIAFEDAIGISRDDMERVKWQSETHPKAFSHSANPPPVDLVPELDGTEKTELEVKLTVVPTFAGKSTEMIVRQNTQFTLAERMAYRHRDLIDSRPLTTDKLRQAVSHADCQIPFMLHGIWKTVGTELKLDEDNTADVYVISDFAYLWMILQNVSERTGNTRMGKVERLVRTWIASYLESGTMRYKERGQNIEHLKITLYPTDYLEGLKADYGKPRLNMDDVMNIVPVESIRKMSPERRLDASIFLHYLMRD